MRTIFLALIVLNLVYFAWNYYHPPESHFKAPPPLGRDVKILSLLSETREGSELDYRSMEKAEELVDSAPGDTPVDTAERCYSLGPFRKALDAERVKVNIEARELSVTLRISTKRRKRGYWVYLPPLANRKAAVKTAKELARKGIEDYLVIASGENENAISLGLYTKAVAAQRRLSRIRTLGYEPVQEPSYKEASEYWLDYREVGDKDLPTEFWELLAYAEDKLQRLERDCVSSTDVASKTVQ